VEHVAGLPAALQQAFDLAPLRGAQLTVNVSGQKL
jgi:hypothetical protein